MTESNQNKRKLKVIKKNWTLKIKVRQHIKSGIWRTPFEELHEQTDIEDSSQDEKEAVPQPNAGVESWEIQVVVVTDSSDHCVPVAHVHM